MLQKLKDLLEAVKALKRDIQKHAGPQIAKKGLRERAEALGALWFSDIRPALDAESPVPSIILDKYGTGFAKLIKLSAPNNLRTRYLGVLGELIKRFRDELILPQQQAHRTGSGSLALLSQFLGQLSNAEENDYLD